MNLRYTFAAIFFTASILPAASADLKIVTRISEANGLHKSVSTKYFQGQRQRTEWGASGATIYQCDLGQRIELNLPVRLFNREDFPSPARASGPTNALRAEAAYEYLIRVHDTGEKATVFGLPAWHVKVVTIKRHRPSGVTQETVTDYWFVDLQVTEACGRLPADFNDYLLKNADKLKVKRTGDAKFGFAVLARTVTIIGGKKFESVREVTELSTSTLDPALFEVPPGFNRMLRSGDTVYRNRPDTPAGRLELAWDQFWKGAANFIF